MHTLYVLARSSVTITVTYPCCKEIRNETLLAKRLALRLGRRIGRMAATHTSWIMDAKKSAAKAAPSEDVDKLSGPELVLVVWLERTQRPRNLGIHLSYSYSFPPGGGREKMYTAIPARWAQLFNLFRLRLDMQGYTLVLIQLIHHSQHFLAPWQFLVGHASSNSIRLPFLDKAAHRVLAPPCVQALATRTVTSLET